MKQSYPACKKKKKKTDEKPMWGLKIEPNKEINSVELELKDNLIKTTKIDVKHKTKEVKN
jgi:hypothetical protein